MDFELTAGERVDVDFAPKNVQMEILQNCSTILSTSKFNVPLDRDFGIGCKLCRCSAVIG